MSYSFFVGKINEVSDTYLEHEVFGLRQEALNYLPKDADIEDLEKSGKQCEPFELRQFREGLIKEGYCIKTLYALYRIGSSRGGWAVEAIKDGLLYKVSIDKDGQKTCLLLED